MNTARIVVVTIALGAGGVAAYLVRDSETRHGPSEPVAQQLPTADVPVARSEIGPSQSVKPEDVQWRARSAVTANNLFNRRADKPDAVNDAIGSIARSPLISGEPIREQKLVMAKGTEFMAAIQPSGMWAVSAETGAGGFILPNDHVADGNISDRKFQQEPLKRGESISVVRYSEQNSMATQK
jgi:pilus assembly protein CpaB